VEPSPEVDAIARIVVDTAVKLHIDTGPGLLESVYEAVLASRLTERGLHVERQKRIPITIDGHTFAEGFRADLLVGRCVLVELKSVETIQPVHLKQLLTYLRLSRLPVGLLINFGNSSLRSNIRRVANGLALSSVGVLA